MLVTFAQAAGFVAGLEGVPGCIGKGRKPHPVPPAQAPSLQQGSTNSADLE